jgi:hypothetical protein
MPDGRIRAAGPASREIDRLVSCPGYRFNISGEASGSLARRSEEESPAIAMSYNAASGREGQWKCEAISGTGH